MKNKNKEYSFRSNVSVSLQKNIINLDEEILIKAYNKYDIKLYNNFFSIKNRRIDTH